MAAAIFTALLGARVLAIAPISDNSEIFVTGTASAAYNNNIFLSHDNEKADEIFDLSPGLSYEFGKTNSLTAGALAASEDFSLYAHKSSLNNQLFNGSFFTKYDDSKTSLNFDASFHQVDQPERTIQNLGFLVNRDLSHVDLLGEVQVTEKSSVGAGIVFDDTDYKAPGFSDWRYVAIPLNYYYKFEPKLDLSAGFSYQSNTLGGNGIDSNTEYYNIGARGEFTPNLTGKFTIGLLNEDYVTGKRNSGLGVDSGFTYAYSPKTSVTFGVTDNYGYAAVGDGYRNFGTYVGFNTAVDSQLSVNGQISYNGYTYVTSQQKDNFYSGRVGIAYTYSTNVTFAGGVTYATDNSNISADSFNNTIFTVSATIHY